MRENWANVMARTEAEICEKKQFQSELLLLQVESCCLKLEACKDTLLSTLSAWPDLSETKPDLKTILEQKSQGCQKLHNIKK